jgi:transposase InsO family protein
MKNNKNTELKDAYSAAELVALNVTGWPTSEYRMRVRLDREGVEAVERECQGGKNGKRREYLLTGLPRELRIALAALLASDAARAGQHEGRKAALTETITEQARSNRNIESLKASVKAPVNGQRRLDARLQLLSAFDRYHLVAGTPIAAGRFQFAACYNRGEIEIDAWVREIVPEVSAASLWRWQRALKTNGVTALAGDYGNRKGESIVDRQPALQEFAVSMLVAHPHCSTGHLMQAVRARFNGHNAIDYPSPRALQRWVANWKNENKQTFTALTNPDAWKGKYMAAFGSQSADIERLNQRWELDSTPGDVMLTDGRHAVIGVIDVYSRRARLLVSKTSKATAIATLLRHTLLQWGVPEVAKTDRGTDYVSNHIRRVFAGLDIEHELCPPFQPWHKPHIERFFGTFSHDLVELLHGFIGHNVAERQAIEARASFADRLLKRGGTLEVSMSSAEFQDFCDRWCEDAYLHNAHEGLKGKTPFEMVAGARDRIRSVSDERALDVLLAEAPANNGLRTVQKKGVELDRAWFIAPELEAYIGNQVHVRFDPVDLGRLYVFDLEEGFICIAECPERTGMDRQLVAAKAREMQKGRVQEERRALKAAAKRARTDDIVHEILVDRAEKAGKLSHLPTPATAHESAGLAAAAQATRARRAPQAAPLTDEDRAALQALEQEMAQGRPRRVAAVPIDNPEFNYKRWNALQSRIAGGAQLSGDELAWHRSYQGSDEWRSMERMAQDFPELKQA